MEVLKKENERLLDSELVIHWWNHGKKNLSFKGTVSEFLITNAIAFNVSYGSNTIEVSYNLGRFNEIKLSCNSLEDMVRMIVNFQLTYLGDKAQFSFNGRTRKINF